MTETYRVAILNRPIIIHGMKLSQLGLTGLAIGFSLFLARILNSHIQISGIPLNVLICIFSFVLLLVPIKMTSIRPLNWWLHYLEYSIKKTIPINFPTVNFSSINHSTLKILKGDFANLSATQQKQILDVITDFAGGDGHSLQVFAPSINSSQNKLKREFYIVSDSKTNSPNNLPDKLQRVCLPISKVNETSLRKLIFSYLSPGHYEDEAQLPPVTPHINDLLTLCLSGFEQQSEHLIIDGKYVANFFFQTLPPESYFGFLNRLLELDCNISLSTHFRKTRDPQIRKIMKRNFHIGVMPNNTRAKGSNSTAKDFIRVIKGEREALEISTYLTLYADDEEQLIADSTNLHNFITSFGGVLSSAKVQEFDALLTMLPLNKDLIGCTHTVLPLVAQTFVPFA